MTQTALVTGAATGLGNIIATHLLQQGFQLVLTDVNLQQVQQAAQKLGNHEGRILALALDIRQVQDIEKALAATLEHFGSLEVLVNNAALTLITPVMDIKPDEFDRVITTNLRGTFISCQTIGRYFAKRGYGRIINLASLAGQNGGSGTGAHYAASKGGILTLTKVFARELSKFGVTVNAIAPGPLDVPSVHALLSAEKLAGLLQMIPVGQLGDADFVAQVVALLASPQAASVTGATWDINGGLNMR
ncbi:SDR family NAD(P)-dependent oxidoreductase [Enterobacter asburiae]